MCLIRRVRKVVRRLLAAQQLHSTKLACLACGWLGAWNLPAQLATPTHDLSRDFPSASNPAGAWSLGWKSTLDGPFSLLLNHYTLPDAGGGIYEFWLRTPDGPSSVYRNAG